MDSVSRQGRQRNLEVISDVNVMRKFSRGMEVHDIFQKEHIIRSTGARRGMDEETARRKQERGTAE